MLRWDMLVPRSAEPPIMRQYQPTRLPDRPATRVGNGPRWQFSGVSLYARSIGSGELCPVVLGETAPQICLMADPANGR